MENERIILSIDIGVKNLAFCLMSAKDEYSEGNNFNIYEWKSVNLIDEDYPSCQGLLKSGKRKGQLCGKSSKIKTNDTKYYCISHNPDKKKYKPRKAKKVKSVLLKDKCLALYKTLDELPHLVQKPVEIVIEQQMKKNPTMLQMAHLVYSYFIMRGYVNPESPIRNVRFVSARNKLKVYNGPELECHLRNAYNRRKWFACEYTKWMIRNDPIHSEYLDKFPKKKDDLSDCYLQGVWWLKRNGIVKHKGTKKKPRKYLKKRSYKQNKKQTEICLKTK
jgi:hypothetical protein